MRWVALFGIALLIGCAQTRVVSVSTRPADATLKIDGKDVGRGPITHKFEFRTESEQHSVVATRPGYKDHFVSITPTGESNRIFIEMRPKTRMVTFTIKPVPATLSIDGKAVNAEPVSQLTRELEFTKDANERWTTHRVTAERAGYEPVAQTISWTDSQQDYVLDLQAKRKDLSITSAPGNAEIYLDEQLIGSGKVTYAKCPFPVDPATNEFVPHKLKAVAPGYPPGEMTIGWDEGKSDYHIDLAPYTKTARIVTDPPGAVVSVEGAEVSSDPKTAASLVKLRFPPINEKGALKTYPGTATKRTQDSEWVPAKFTLAWDEGKPEYRVQLEEIKTRPVALLRMKPARADDGWHIEAEQVNTLAMKDLTEGPKRESPARVVRVAKGTSIDSLTVSPDGSQILYTTLAHKPGSELTSQMIAVRADGTSGSTILSDGKSLDVTPSYAPDGTQIVFSSNRFGKRQSILIMSSTGQTGVSKITGGESEDLWPTLDSSPQPRLYYEARMSNRADPRLFMTQLGSTILMDLTQGGGLQPRVGPKGDAVAFAAINEKTGRRDLFRTSDKGGPAENLTNTADVDEFDAVWSVDGSKLAFVSDRNISNTAPDNYDIWVLELAHPDKAVQLTVNGSCDDRPCWDANGKSIYFRSNRGGEWGIWRIDVK